MNIYKITNLINGKIYIGKEKFDDPKYMGSGLLIKRAIKKYGLDNFKKSIIEETNNYIYLCDREKYWIDFYKSTNPDVGYNISDGGDGGDVFKNHPDLESIKRKISDSSPIRGKKYEEYFGPERAKSIREKLSKNHGRWNKGLGIKKAKGIKREINRKNKEDLIKKEIESINNDYHNLGFNRVYERIKIISGKTPNTFFKNRMDFYLLLDPSIIKDMDKKHNEERSINGRSISKNVIIDGILYDSIREASEKTGVTKKTIKRRYL